MIFPDCHGKVYKLDDAGHKNAAEALRNRADRSNEPSAKDLSADDPDTAASASSVNASVAVPCRLR